MNDNLKLGKLGYSEGNKLHSSNKRLLGTVDGKSTHKDKSKQVKAVCDKCGSVFSMRGEKSPTHNRIISSYIKNDKGVGEWVDVTEVCDGKLLIVGKENLSEYKFTFIRHIKPYAAKAMECVIKPGDTVIAEVSQYIDGSLKTVVIEKTIKSIVREIKHLNSWYYNHYRSGKNKKIPKIDITIFCTDGTEFPKSVKDIEIC